MPIIPSPLGVLPFVAIKLAGYTAMGAYVTVSTEVSPYSKRVAPFPPIGALGVGVARTIVGIVGGVAYALMLEGAGVTAVRWQAGARRS